MDDSGTALGCPIVINTTTASAEDDATIAGLADGGLVIGRTDSSAFSGFTFAIDIQAQAFLADGSLNEAEVLVNTLTDSVQREASVTGLADGRFVVSWTDLSAVGTDTSFAVRAQIFNAQEHAIHQTSKVGSDSFVGTKFKDA